MRVSIGAVGTTGNAWPAQGFSFVLDVQETRVKSQSSTGAACHFVNPPNQKSRRLASFVNSALSVVNSPVTTSGCAVKPTEEVPYFICRSVYGQMLLSAYFSRIFNFRFATWDSFYVACPRFHDIVFLKTCSLVIAETSEFRQ